MTRRPGVIALADALRPWVEAIRLECRREKALRASLKRERKLRGAKLREARERLRIGLLRTLLWPTRPCPVPGIEQFRSAAEVERLAVSVMRKSLTPVEAWAAKCECGFWHLHLAPGEPEWEQ